MPKKKEAVRSAAQTRGSGGKSPGGRKNRPAVKPIRREVGAVVCLFLGLFSFIGYFEVDAWFISMFCGFIKGLIGWGYYIFPPALLGASVILAFHRGQPVAFRIVSTLLLPLLIGALISLLYIPAGFTISWEAVKELYDLGVAEMSGGVISGLLAALLRSAFSIFGSIPLLLAATIFFIMGASNKSIKKIYERFKNRQRPEYEAEPEPEAVDPAPAPRVMPSRADERRRRRAIDIPLDDGEPHEEFAEERVGFFNTKSRVKTPDQAVLHATRDVEPLCVEDAARVAGIDARTLYPSAAEQTSQKIKAEETAEELKNITGTIESAMAETDHQYNFPPTDLLKTGGASAVDGREEIALNRERLESTIHSFGVSATVTGVTRGPTVTRYDLELEAGVKLAKLTNLAGDLALSLGVSGVRIAPIPDKISTVGVEVPNKLISMVYLRDIIESANFQNSPSKLTFAIGEDIGGNAIVGNIAKLPHMLIAGTTGSGKSVCMNSLLLSLLYKATPDEVRIIMIDPKMVELGLYNGIPHLYIPVVTDPKKAAGALQWSVVEMLKRYRLFSEAGVRDLAGYNAHQRNNDGQTLPQVVIVIDELADLMLVASKEVEESICRVAQMGRASGMHLVIATQRPSADVITGLMKANIPSRIAFAVSSALESRIILDTQGAEKLIGAGDMLYSPIGSGKPMRIQGAFVSDAEREKVINFVKSSCETQYNDEIMEEIEKAAADKQGAGGAKAEEAPSNDYDELLPQAVDVIFETRQASVSMLQRRLKLGYSRAARIVDQMEEMGVVGPFEGSKPRTILISRQDWQEMQLINGTAPLKAVGDEPVFSDFKDIDSEDWRD